MIQKICFFLFLFLFISFADTINLQEKISESEISQILENSSSKDTLYYQGEEPLSVPFEKWKGQVILSINGGIVNFQSNKQTMGQTAQAPLYYNSCGTIYCNGFDPNTPCGYHSIPETQHPEIGFYYYLGQASSYIEIPIAFFDFQTPFSNTKKMNPTGTNNTIQVLSAVLHLLTSSVTNHLFYVIADPYQWSSFPPVISLSNYVSWYTDWQRGAKTGEFQGIEGGTLRRKNHEGLQSMLKRGEIVGEFQANLMGNEYDISIDPSLIPTGSFGRLYIIPKTFYDYVIYETPIPDNYCYFYIDMNNEGMNNYVNITYQEASSGNFSLNPALVSIPDNSTEGQTIISNLTSNPLNYNLNLASITKLSKKKTTQKTLMTDWITASPLQGAIPANDSDVIKITVNRQGQESGEYEAIYIVSDDTEEEQELRVRVTVPDPVIQIEPTAVHFSGTESEKEIIITNNGGGILSWQAEIQNTEKKKLLNSEWLSTDKDSGNIQSGQTETLTLTVNRQGLEPGDYEKNINITSNAGNSVIPVQMTVDATPILTISPTNVYLYTDRTKGSIELENSGNGNCVWNANINLQEITLSDSSGTLEPGAKKIVDIFLDRTIPEAGKHNVEFNISSTGSASITVRVSYEILTEPTIIILSPEEETSWEAGSMVWIKWQAINALGSKSFFYSTDNGTNYTEIIFGKKLSLDDTIITDSILWQIPEEIQSDSCRIMIKLNDDETVFGTSSPFKIQSSKNLRLVSPTDSDILYNDWINYHIKWEYTGTIENINIFQKNDGTQEWSELAMEIPASSGEYLWNIETLNLKNCFLKIEDSQEPDITDSTEEPFMIVKAPTFTITDPESGSSIIGGNPKKILWTWEGYSETIDLFYSSAPDVYTLIAQEITNNGSYEWNVPAVYLEDMFLKIRDHRDTSQYYFFGPYTIDYPIYFEINPHIIFIDDKSASIQWKTNTPILCSMWYKKESSNEWILFTDISATDNQVFEANLEGLTPNTRYQYKISFYLENGTKIKDSETFSFHTLSEILTPNYQFLGKPQVLYITNHEAGISFYTEQEAEGIIKITKESDQTSKEILEETTSLEHIFSITDLDSNSTYYIQCGVIPPNSNEVIYYQGQITVKTLKNPDTQAPDILKGPFLAISDSSVSIQFETSEASTATIRLFDSQGNLFIQKQNSELSIKHHFLFRYLEPGKNYSFTMEIKDFSNNSYYWGGEKPLLSKLGIDSFQMMSGGNSFSTNENSDTTPPAFTTIPNALAIYDSAAVIEWKTNEQTRSVIYIYSNSNLIKMRELTEFNYSHTAYITGLTPSSSYEAVIELYDIENNHSENLEKTIFTTRKNNTPIPTRLVEPIQTYQSEGFTVFTWKTDLAGDSKSIISDNSNLSSPYYQYSHAITKEHLLVVSSLEKNADYFYQISTNDYYDQNIYLSEADSIQIKTNPGEENVVFLEGPELTGISDNYVKINWKNNEMTSGVLEYYPVDIPENVNSINTNSISKDQELSIHKLLPATQYECKLTVNTFMNAEKDTSFTFTTLAEADTISPVRVDSVQVEINENGFFVISWKPSISADISHYKIIRYKTGLTDSLLLATNYQNTKFIDDNIELLTEYIYGIITVDVHGNESSISFSNSVVKINENEQTNDQNKLFLKQNYPNPFNQHTTIEFYTPKEESIELIVYNLIGLELYKEEFYMTANSSNTITLNTKHWSAGIYFYRIQTKKGERLIKKMILLK